MTRWGILTGEYPPQPGGVSDYTRLIAQGLSAAGDEVDVVAPTDGPAVATAPEWSTNKLRVHRLPRGFHFRNFRRIETILAAAKCDRVLVQYVPHSFGWKGMNIPLARWIRRELAPRFPVDVMFHEVIFPFSWFPLRYAILGQATAYMARQIASAADRIFVSVPAWQEIVGRLCPSAREALWLPVPSNVPSQVGDEAVAAVRSRLDCGTPIVGHFGTYGKFITDLLTPALERILAQRDDVRVLLMGRNSDDYRRQFLEARPRFSERVLVTGPLDGAAVAAHLRACDVLLQPYPDGVSSRRGSVMAGLCNGAAVVTNLGRLSDPLWSERGVAAVASPDATELAARCLELLADDASRRRIAAEGLALYAELFAPERTVRVLQDWKRT